MCKIPAWEYFSYCFDSIIFLGVLFLGDKEKAPMFASVFKLMISASYMLFIKKKFCITCIPCHSIWLALPSNLVFELGQFFLSFKGVYNWRSFIFLILSLNILSQKGILTSIICSAKSQITDCKG